LPEDFPGAFIPVQLLVIDEAPEADGLALPSPDLVVVPA
jgi:hypothetical protein